MATPDRLSQDELAVVLRRAAELDSAGSADADPGLPLATVEAAAAEVGLDAAAVRQAVAELRAGMLEGPEPDALPPDVVVVARLVPVELGHALDATDRFLCEQMLERVRDRGVSRTYCQRDDKLATMLRAFDFRGESKRLKAVHRVEVRGVAVEGGTLLRLTATLRRPVVLAPRVVGAGAAIVTAGVVGTGALLLGPDVLLALGLPAGAAAGVGSWRAGQAAVERERRQVAEVADGFLDQLELGRRPGEARALDKLRRHAARLRGPWA